MRILLPDLSHHVPTGSLRPGSLPLIRAATVDGLRTFGHDAIVAESSDGAEVDLALVDVTDAPTAAALDGLNELRATGVRVVLRVHGAWSSPDDSGQDPDEVAFDATLAPVSLGRLFELSDRVLVSTRSHLVRLASAHRIDVERVKLLAPPRPGAGWAAPNAPAGARPIGLVLGEASSLGVEAAVDALEKAGHQVVRFEARGTDAATCGALRGAVAEARTVAVVAAIPWSDRVLVDACAGSGAAVVASCGPALEESARPSHVVALPLDATDEEWAAGVAAALRTPQPERARRTPEPGAHDASAESLRRLTGILFEAAASARDCPGHRAA